MECLQRRSCEFMLNNASVYPTFCKSVSNFSWSLFISFLKFYTVTVKCKSSEVSRELLFASCMPKCSYPIRLQCYLIISIFGSRVPISLILHKEIFTKERLLFYGWIFPGMPSYTQTCLDLPGVPSGSHDSIPDKQ